MERFPEFAELLVASVITETSGQRPRAGLLGTSKVHGYKIYGGLKSYTFSVCMIHVRYLKRTGDNRFRCHHDISS
jgi:hypothetical protein